MKLFGVINIVFGAMDSIAGFTSGNISAGVRLDVLCARLDCCFI